jgi:hypothetical protein
MSSPDSPMVSSCIFGSYEKPHINLIHRRLYPIIYFPALLLYSLSHIPPNLRHILLSSSSLSLPLSLRKHSQTSKEKPNPCLERMNFLLKRFKIFPIHSVAIPVTVQFLLSALIAFLVPALISYLQYGDSYLKEAILYHFGRFATTTHLWIITTLGLTPNITSLRTSFGFTPVRLTETALEANFSSLSRPQSLR